MKKVLLLCCIYSLVLCSCYLHEKPVKKVSYSRVLNIYNWGDYIAPNIILNFEKETGIKVNYDTYDSNEILQTKLVAGGSGYDIVVPTSPWASLQIKSQIYQKLDKSLIPNLSNQNPKIQNLLSQFDKDNQYLVVWSMIFTTIGINVNKIKSALGNLPMPANEWELFFNPKYLSKFQSCGVIVLDSPSDIIAQSLLYLGKNPYSINKDDYILVDNLLRSIRPYIGLISSSGHIDDLANGSACFAIAYSGDINIARKRAIDNKTKEYIKGLVPKSNVLLDLDVMAIPSDAKNVRNANLFINFLVIDRLTKEYSGRLCQYQI